MGLIYKSESIAIRTDYNRNTDWNTGKQCVQEGKHRNAMLEQGIGTGKRLGTGTGTGTKLETETLRVVLVISKFKHGTKFWESWESV